MMNDSATDHTNNSIQAPVHDFSTDPTWAIAFNICPRDKYTDLNRLINDADDFIEPSTILPNILMTVSQWNLYHTTRSTHPTSTTTTTVTTNNDNE